MDTEFTNQEINWHTISKYIDIETGEIISKELATKEYIITKKNKNVKIYKKTGTINYIYECTKSRQLKLFE